MDAGELISRYEQASAVDDFDTLGALRHSDWRMEWPQSGEVVPNHLDYVAMRLNRPEGAPSVEPLRHGGSDDLWWSEQVIHYGDGSRWLAVSIVELRDGLVHSERVYFAQPFSPPTWRSHWVQHGAPAITDREDPA